MLGTAWNILKDAGSGYIADDCPSRGAAIAYYTVFSLAPVLVIIIAVAGLVFGAEAARGALVEQIAGMMGRQGAEAVQAMVASAGNPTLSSWAGIIGVVTLIVTASGVFGEIQSSLNAIWRAKPDTGAVSRLVRARLVSLGLVLALGFLLIVSLVVSTAISAAGGWAATLFPGADSALRAVSLLVSLVLVAALFAAIYKVLPDTPLRWRDVLVGAFVTAVLVNLGKYAISAYLGSSSAASTFGAAAALAAVLLWVYYTAQIFLFGAEITRAWAETVRGRAPVTAPPVREVQPAAPQGPEGELSRMRAELDGATPSR